MEELVYRIVWSTTLQDGTVIEWIEAYSPIQELAQAYLRKLMDRLDVVNEEHRPKQRARIQYGCTVQGANRL